jgi:hypothetical protein
MGYINQSKSYQQFTKYMEQENYIDKPKDKITIAVMEDLKLRSDRGYIKYGTTLNQNNHQNMLQHAYEEALDLAQYLKKEILTLNTVQDLVAHYPNDAELGAKIRELYGEKQVNGDRAEN